MARKNYTEGTVTYGASGRKWSFNSASGFQFSSMNMPGGVVTAHKVARLIEGGVKRTGKGDIDARARANIAQVFHKAAAAVPKTRSLNSQGFFC